LLFRLRIPAAAEGGALATTQLICRSVFYKHAQYD
jgi:hypothetical protein